MALTKTINYTTDVKDPITGDFITFETTHSLGEWKQCRKREIDLNSERLIQQGGFTWNSKVFKLDTDSKISLLALFETRNEPSVTYPIELSLKDNTVYSIADATEMYNVGMTALGTAKTINDAGRTLKAAIDAASDIEGVDAVVDNR